MNVYATVAELKEYLSEKMKAHIDATDESLLMRFTIEASRSIDGFASKATRRKRKFYPTFEARDFNHPGSPGGTLRRSNGHDSSSALLVSNPVSLRTDELRLKGDLLEISTLTSENGDVSITSADWLALIKLRSDDIYGLTPYNTIRLQPDGTVKNFTFSGTQYASNQLTGYWGYHDDWANAFADTLDNVRDDPLSDSATTLTVLDPNGLNALGFPDRFMKQQLLRIGTEYLHVAGVDTKGNTLTVVRGVNGTTAASHVQGTQIFVYQAPYDIQLAMKTLATYSYRRKDTVGTPQFRQMSRDNKRVLVAPSSLPSEVKEIIMGYTTQSL